MRSRFFFSAANGKPFSTRRRRRCRLRGPAAAPAGQPQPPVQPPPTVVNLIDGNMPPIRDQACRGTCVVFASIVCLEYHLNRFGNQVGLDLSEQFQYWNMVTTTGHRNLVSAYPLLASAGSCRKITWPYYGCVMAGNDSQDPPPSTAVAEAMAYRCTQVRQITPARDISAIQAELQRGRIVGIGIPGARAGSRVE